MSGTGDRVVDAGPDVTVAQLVDALVPPVEPEAGPRSLRIERTGAVLAPSRLLSHLDLRSGDRVGVVELSADTPLDEGPDPTAQPSAALRFLTGPLAGQTFDLGPGTTTVGRAASNDLVLADPGLSRRHAVLSVDPSAVVVTDLGATNGVRIEGLPIEGPTALVSGQRLLLGQSWVAVDHHPVPALPVDGRLRFDRPQRLVSTYQGRIYRIPAPPDLPEGGSRLGPLSGRVQHRQLAHAYEELLDQVMADLAAGRREERDHRLQESPSIDDVLRAARARTRLWERRLTDPDVLRVRLGLAELPTRHQVEVEAGGDPTLRLRVDRLPRTYATIDGVPATVDLGRPGGLTLRGPRERVRPLAASLVGQLVGLNPPDRLGVLLFGDVTEDWDWLKWLPHADLVGDGRPPTGPEAIELVTRMLDAGRAGQDGVPRPPYVVVIVDDAEALAPAGSGSPAPAELVRLMANGVERGLHPLLLTDDGDDLPLAASGLFGATLSVGPSTGRLTLRSDGLQVVEPVLLEQTTPETLVELGRLMASLELRRPADAPVTGAPDVAPTGAPDVAPTGAPDVAPIGEPDEAAGGDPRRLTIEVLRFGPPAGPVDGRSAPDLDDAQWPDSVGGVVGLPAIDQPSPPEWEETPDLFDLPRSADDSRLLLGRFRMPGGAGPSTFAFNPSRDGTLGLVGSAGPAASACLLTVASASARLDCVPGEFPMLYGLGTDESLDPLILLPNVCGLAGDDAGEAIEVLAELEQLMDDRLVTFDLAGVDTIDEFRSARPDVVLRRVLVLIDGLGRLADLLEEDFPSRTREVVGQLLELGSGLGLHLVFSVVERDEVDPLLIPKVGRWLEVVDGAPGRVDLDGTDVRFAVPGGSWERASMEQGMSRVAAEASGPVAPVDDAVATSEAS